MIVPTEKIYSFAEAVEWFEAHGYDVPEGTFNSHVHVHEGRITPLKFGEREYDDRTWARGVVFTERMLRAYAGGETGIEPTAEELRDFVGKEDAMNLLGMSSLGAVNHHVYNGNIWHQKVGNVSVLYRPDLEDFKANRRRGVGAARGAKHFSTSLTEADVREMRRLKAEGWTLSRLAEKYDMSESGVSRIVRRLSWAHVE